MTAKTDRALNTTTTFTYDAEHLLRSVTRPDGQSTTYRYDPLGRRIEVASPTATERFTYGADQNMATRYDGANSVEASFTFGLGMDTPLAMRRNGATSYYEQDALGSVTSLSGASGSEAQRYAYGSFGQPLAASDATGNPFTYTARDSIRVGALKRRVMRVVVGEAMIKQTSDRAGTFVTQPSKYRAFIPKPLPPVPPVSAEGDLLALFSEARVELGRLDGLVKVNRCPNRPWQ